MAASKLPPIREVASLPAQERAKILDLLFEPSTQLHTLSVPLLHEKGFESYPDLISAVGVQLTELSESASTSDTQWLESILGSHPRLGANKVDSAQSAAEQAQLQGSGDEAEMLRKLNAEYEAKFPGLRYVVFVNGRSRPVIMEDMRRRIDMGDQKGERIAAIRVSLLRVSSLTAVTDTGSRQCAKLQLIEHLNCHSDNACCIVPWRSLYQLSHIAMHECPALSARQAIKEIAFHTVTIPSENRAGLHHLWPD